MDIAGRLRELLDQRRLTQSRLAELAGVPNETINRIVTGRTRNPGVYTLLKIVRPLEVTLGWLVGEKGFEFSGDHRAELRRFKTVIEELLEATQPVDPELQPPNASAVTLGRKPPRRAPRRGRATPAAATDWRESFGERREERELDVPEQFADHGATLIFRAEGESMIGEHVADGDLLYVREQPDPRHARGKIVVCVVGGSPYVKRLELTAGQVRLVSANERFAPMMFDEDSVDWNLVGVVVGWSHEAR
jgi:transcriptional regulator with XRE-family HTH domain